MRLDLGLTSPQAQWLSRGGSGIRAQGSLDAGSSHSSSADLGAHDSPFKHRWANKLQGLSTRVARHAVAYQSLSGVMLVVPSQCTV